MCKARKKGVTSNDFKFCDLIKNMKICTSNLPIIIVLFAMLAELFQYAWIKYLFYTL
jgi:hypothetical protein